MEPNCNYSFILFLISVLFAFGKIIEIIYSRFTRERNRFDLLAIKNLNLICMYANRIIRYNIKKVNKVISVEKYYYVARAT